MKKIHRLNRSKTLSQNQTQTFGFDYKSLSSMVTCLITLGCQEVVMVPELGRGEEQWRWCSFDGFPWTHPFWCWPSFN